MIQEPFLKDPSCEHCVYAGHENRCVYDAPRQGDDPDNFGTWPRVKLEWFCGRGLFETEGLHELNPKEWGIPPVVTVREFYLLEWRLWERYWKLTEAQEAE